jgi:hypothetical protein
LQSVFSLQTASPLDAVCISRVPSRSHERHHSQPGLDSLSKSFEPAAIEAHWGPEWEKRGYGNAGYRGTGQPGAEATAAGNNFAIQLPPPM